MFKRVVNFKIEKVYLIIKGSLQKTYCLLKTDLLRIIFILKKMYILKVVLVLFNESKLKSTLSI